MKKFLLAAAFSFLAVAGMNAQIVSSRSVNIKTTEVKKPKTTTWVLRVGMNMGKFVGDDADDLFDASKIGYDFSIAFQKPITDIGLFWGMDFGLSTRAWSYEEGDYKDHMLNHSFRWSPFMLGYKYDINDKFAVDAHIGAFVSVDYAGKIKAEETDYNGDTYKDEWNIGEYDDYYGDDWNRVDAGMTLGVGVWYDRFNLDFTWQRGFIAPVKDAKMASSNLMLRLGVAF